MSTVQKCTNSVAHPASVLLTPSPSPLFCRKGVCVGENVYMHACMCAHTCVVRKGDSWGKLCSKQAAVEGYRCTFEVLSPWACNQGCHCVAVETSSRHFISLHSQFICTVSTLFHRKMLYFHSLCLCVHAEGTRNSLCNIRINQSDSQRGTPTDFSDGLKLLKPLGSFGLTLHRILLTLFEKWKLLQINLETNCLFINLFAYLLDIYL